MRDFSLESGRTDLFHEPDVGDVLGTLGVAGRGGWAAGPNWTDSLKIL